MRNIQEAKDPDLRASAAAIRRAAQAARRTAIQTGTNLIIVKNGQLVRLSPEELQKESEKA